MAKKTKKIKSKKAKTPEKKERLNPYTEEKNNQPPVQVIEEAKIVGEETRLPETMSVVPIKEFAMPIARPEQLQKAMELYQECVNALIKSSDIVLIEGKPHGKKIAVNKINRVFGVSTEVIKSFQEEHIAYKDYWSKGYRKVILVRKGEKYMVAKAWVKAILPNGQFCTRGAAVSETERRFAHTPHDLIATAETRAMKNAAINLLGVEFELMEEKEKNEKPEKKTYKPKPNEDKKTIDLPTGEVGVDPNRWKPMYKAKYGKSYPTNDKMAASSQQLQVITEALRKVEIEPTEVILILNNRADGIPREKMLIDCDKGDCFDIISAIMKGKEEFLKLIKKEEPPEEEVN